MSDSDFEASLRRTNPDTWEALQRLQSERAATAREASRIAIRRARCASLLDTVERHNNNTVGTPPEDVFGTRGAALCRGFLGQMAALDYPRIDKLEGEFRLPGGQLGTWQVRGYYLGKLMLPKGSRDDFTPAGTDRRAFLCEDGLLRAALYERSKTLVGNIPLFVDRDDAPRRMVVQLTTYRQDREWVEGGWSPDVDGGRNSSGSYSEGYWIEKPPVEVPCTLGQVLADRMKYAIEER